MALSRLRPGFESRTGKYFFLDKFCDFGKNTAKKRNTEKNKEIYYSRPTFGTKKKCILIIHVQRGRYFAVFFQIQRANSLY